MVLEFFLFTSVKLFFYLDAIILCDERLYTETMNRRELLNLTEGPGINKADASIMKSLINYITLVGIRI